jgi:putative nucleotidyltransferase with HDIG domain
MVPYYVVSGPLAYSYVMAFQKMGVTGLLAFALPPLMMMVSVRQYVNRTRESVEEVRTANTALEQTNADLQALFDVTAGLAARTYDRAALVDYATGVLEALTGCEVQIFGDAASGSIPIVASDKVLGSLELRGGETSEQWARLRVAVLPQLGTALESVNRIDEINKRHLATIAALSHSMEAKDNYTGGHTERVAELAVALARRLGCQGEELQALEVGALLHDIGKIGISESLLHKPGPLDETEWQVMRQHPLISERILSDIGLSPIVLDIARSSHERIDGNGYPHGLAGDEIPLAARIVLVADAFDALTSDRPYRERRSPQRALDEIRAHAGTQFCVRCVEALEQIYRDEPQLLGLNPLRVVGAA